MGSRSNKCAITTVLGFIEPCWSRRSPGPANDIQERLTFFIPDDRNGALQGTGQRRRIPHSGLSPSSPSPPMRWAGMRTGPVPRVATPTFPSLTARVSSWRRFASTCPRPRRRGDRVAAGCMVAVGTRIAPRPPHRSRRALLTHRAPPSGRTSVARGLTCGPAHSRQSDRRGNSAQCPNHGRLSAVPLG
jgi:hypothetical protein